MKKKYVSQPVQYIDLTHVIRIAEKKAHERGVVYGPGKWEGLVGRITDEAETSAGAAYSFDASLLAKLNVAPRASPRNELFDDYLAQEKKGVTAHKAWLWIKRHRRCKNSSDESYELYVYPYERDEEIPMEAKTKTYRRSGFDTALSERKKKFSGQASPN